MSSTSIFLSLPTPTFFEILDYCEAFDVMALSSTCRLFKTRIDETTLVVNRWMTMPAPCEIPIYVADHCHSVLLTCRLEPKGDPRSHYTITIMSRTKHQKGPFATVVWQKTLPHWDRCRKSHIGLRTDPSQEYQLSYDGEYFHNDYHYVEFRKQFMTRSFTATRRRAFGACRAMRSIREDCWHAVKISAINEMRLFMKLFVLSYASSPEVSSPIQRFVTEQRRTQDPDAIIQEIINLFEQALEQKEPMDCRKLPLSMDENHNLQHFGRYEWWQKLYGLPPLMLKKEFTWRRSNNKGRHLDQTEVSLYHDELEFVVRIPLNKKTRRFALNGRLDTDSKMPLFVMFFQISRNDPGDAVENLVEGKVFTWEPRWDFHLSEVKPEYEACFLYLVPGTASRMVVADIEVELGIAADDYSDEFTRWMKRLLETGDVRLSFEEVGLPLRLFGECASAIQGPNAQLYTAWKEAFDMEGLDTTPHGLQCIVEIVNEFLVHPQIGFAVPVIGRSVPTP